MNDLQYKYYAQQGLTLIELMVALAIGLLITAVAVQLFITSQTSWAIQRAMSDMQDSGNFGLEYIAKDIRKANYGAISAVADGSMLYGGIILTQNNVSKYLATEETSSSNTSPFNVNYMSRGIGQAVGVSPAWSGMSNVLGKVSDQLTIQFKALQNVYSEENFAKKKQQGLSATEKDIVVGYDCMGQKITLDDVAKGTYIIQRYFLRKDTNAASTEPNDGLALACAAGRYQVSGIERAMKEEASSSTKAYTPEVISGKLLGSGEIVLRRVDHFHILLGIADGTYDTPTNMRYVTIQEYNAIMNTASITKKPTIRSVSLGLLIRAQDGSGKNLDLKNNKQFDVFDQQNLILKNNATPDTYMRQIVTQTVALRNALGEDDR